MAAVPGLRYDIIPLPNLMGYLPLLWGVDWRIYIAPIIDACVFQSSIGSCMMHNARMDKYLMPISGPENNVLEGY